MIGGAGLVSAAVLGAAGDVVALVDDNPVSRHLLYGLASRSIDRSSLAVSQLSTGTMESFRADDRAEFPELHSIYLAAPESADSRAHERGLTAAMGLGALIPLSIADALVEPSLMLVRLAGADGASKFGTSAQPRSKGERKRNC